jgi:HEAT repeat protein
MRGPIRLVLMIGWLACCGCGKQKSTDELIADVTSPSEKDRIVAVRLLPQRKGNATPRIVSTLLAALQDKEGDVRRSAAVGLGSFGEQARDAVPALQAAQRDRDARVREAAGVALSRIDPARFSATSEPRRK